MAQKCEFGNCTAEPLVGQEVNLRDKIDTQEMLLDTERTLGTNPAEIIRLEANLELKRTELARVLNDQSKITICSVCPYKGLLGP